MMFPRRWAEFRARFAAVLAGPPSKSDFVVCSVLIVVYFVAGRLGLKVAFLQPNVAAIWLPSGISLAAFLLLGYRIWPAILIGDFLLSLSSFGLGLTSLTIALGNTLEGIAGAYLVDRFARGAKAFCTADGVFKFMFFGCILSTSISATVGVCVLSLSEFSTWTHFGYLWFTWWLPNVIGVLVLAPFLILLFGAPHHGFDWRETLELITLILGQTLVGLLVFGPLSRALNEKQHIQVWLCIPFLIWGAFRFCQLEAAGITLILFGSAIWGTLHGIGPFVTPDLNTSLLHLDTFIGVIGTMTLAVAAMVAERRGIESNLLGIQSLLQDAVEGKDRDLAATMESLHHKEVERVGAARALRESHDRFRQLMDKIPVVFWLLDTVAERYLFVSPAYENIWGSSCDSLYADTHSRLDAVHPDDFELALAFFDRQCDSDRFEVEYRIVRPDSSVRWIWDRGFVIRDETGRICRLAGLASDVTDKKLLAQNLLPGGKQGITTNKGV